jgi:hypothetical protein
MGIEEERLRLEWISASEGDKGRRVMDDMVDRLRALGPLGLPDRFREWDRETAARTNCGATRPEHMTRMIRTFDAYFIRETPARSAAVYVHQLQKNATIRGSHTAPLPPGSLTP